MAGAATLSTATTAVSTDRHTGEPAAATVVGPPLAGTEELTRNYFRLCIELSSPHHYSRLAGIGDHSLYLTLPGACFSAPSQDALGFGERYRNFCFNWRLARDQRPSTGGGFGTEDSSDCQLAATAGTYFGAGLIEIVDMADTGTAMAGLALGAGLLIPLSP